MTRTLLVTVGISLIAEHTDEKDRAGGFDQMDSPYPSLQKLTEALRQADELNRWGRTINLNERRWVEAQTALVKALRSLWDSDENEKRKRRWSGAELASLSLLGQAAGDGNDPLSSGDRVVLLASDTPSGQFCAQVIARALSQGLLGVKPDVPKVKVIEGLRADDAESFLYSGLPNAAQAVTEHRHNSLLVVSGGYKGLLPYLTPIAMQLKIPLLYLYEESDTLLEIQPLNIPDDMRLVYEFREAFKLIDPTVGSGLEHPQVFWEKIESVDPVNGRMRIKARKLVYESDDVLKLTSTGVLACLLQPLIAPEG